MSANSRTGYLKAAFNAFLAARERQAERYSSCALLKLDDTSAKAGHNRAEFSKRAAVPYIDA